MNFVRLSMVVRWVCLAALCLLLASSPPPALAQTRSCSRTLTINSVTRNFQNCSVLGELSATIAWNFDSSNHTLEVGFTAVAANTDDVWVAWGINPTSSEGRNFMNGAGVVLARVSNGIVSTGAYDLPSEYPIIPDTPPASTHNVRVLAHDGGFDGTTGKVYAKIVWAPTSVYHGWNSGPLSASGTVMQHDLSQILSKGNLDLLSGAVTA